MKLISKKRINRISEKQSVSYLLSTIVYHTVILVGLFLALIILQPDKAVSSLLAGAVILGLLVGFTFQDLFTRLIVGIYITFKNRFEVGHTVEINKIIGNIEDTQLRFTSIRTFSEPHWMIPDKQYFLKLYDKLFFKSLRSCLKMKSQNPICI